MKSLKLITVLVGASLFFAACSSSSDSGGALTIPGASPTTAFSSLSPTPTTTSTPTTAPTLTTAPAPAPNLVPEVILDTELRALVIASHPRLLQVKPHSYYLAERGGKVWEITSSRRDGNSLNGDPAIAAGKKLVVDISDRVVVGSERGLLGMTFAQSGDWLYLMYSERNTGNVLLAVPITYSEDQATVTPDLAKSVRLMEIFQPFSNHNGGDLKISPFDGYLYIALGDGGSANDPQNNGQNRRTLLGSILRIDPKPEEGRYDIPPDNPYADGRGSNEDFKPEIWAYGTRNPWRISFNPENGDLWAADVGQSTTEEISIIPQGQGGANLGWNYYEGKRAFRSPIPPNLEHLPPIFEYNNGSSLPPRFNQRCSIIGGVFTDDGKYLYADFCDEGVIRYYDLATGEGDLVFAEINDDAGGIVTFGTTSYNDVVIGTESGGTYLIAEIEAS